MIVDHIDLFNLRLCLKNEIANDNTNNCFKDGRHDLIEMILPPHEFASVEGEQNPIVVCVHYYEGPI